MAGSAFALKRATLGVLVKLRLLLVLPALVPVVAVGTVATAALSDSPSTSVHGELIVYAPRPVVWRLLTNFDGYEAWNPYIRAASGRARGGAELDLRLYPQGETARDIECSVITVKKGRKLYWRCRDYAVPGLLDREHTFRVIPVTPDGSTVRVVYDGRWEGVLVPFSNLAMRKEGYREMLTALKLRAERAT